MRREAHKASTRVPTTSAEHWSFRGSGRAEWFSPLSDVPRMPTITSSSSRTRADSGDEVHRVLMQEVFPRQAEVITDSEWTADLPRP